MRNFLKKLRNHFFPYNKVSIAVLQVLFDDYWNSPHNIPYIGLRPAQVYEIITGNKEKFGFAQVYNTMNRMAMPNNQYIRAASKGPLKSYAITPTGRKLLEKAKQRHE